MDNLNDELIYDSVMVQLFKDWLIEESRKADKKAYHVDGQFNLGYAAGLDACCERFNEIVRSDDE